MGFYDVYCMCCFLNDQVLVLWKRLMICLCWCPRKRFQNETLSFLLGPGRSDVDLLQSPAECLIATATKRRRPNAVNPSASASKRGRTWGDVLKSSLRDVEGLPAMHDPHAWTRVGPPDLQGQA